MAILIDKSGQQIGVHSRHLVGRSRRMHTTMRVPEVSAQHAVISWMGDHWSVRDLGSRNGTLVCGKRVDSGVDVRIGEGDEVCFGSEAHSLVLKNADGPGPFARCGEELVVGEGDLLALPSLHDPVVLIAFDDALGWTATRSDVTTEVQQGQSVQVQGRAWVLELPEPVAATADLRSATTTLHDLGLDFSVSADEEYVQVRVRLPSGTVSLTPRAHHYPLLVLARVRLAAANAEVATESGWVYATELQKMLRMGSNRVNLSIYRARRELENIGVVDAQSLVERRLLTKQLRLGVADLTVSSL